MRFKRWVGALCAGTLAVALLSAGRAEAQTIERVFPAVLCTAVVGGQTLQQTQDVTVRVTAPDQVSPGETFTVTFPGGSAVLPSVASGLPVVDYRNLTQSYVIHNTEFVAGSITTTGQTTINGNPITGTATLASPTEIVLGTPGPFPPGTLVTPDVHVQATAGAVGEDVTINANQLTTTVRLAGGALTANATCAIPQDTLITIPVVGGGTNTPPTVNAGPDVSGNEDTAIALDATVTDPDETPTTAWTIDGASCTFADAAAVDTTVTCADPGTYTATLTADDGTNPPVSDTAQVTVNPVGGEGCVDPCLSIGDSTTAEDGVASLAITLTQPVATDVTVDTLIVDGSATNGFGLPREAPSDFKKRPDRTVTIKAGRNKAYINVRTFADDVEEADETFSVTLSNAVGANIDRDTGTATITDTTGSPAGQLVFGTATIVEVDGCERPCPSKVTAKVPVVLTEPSLDTVTVEYQTADAGATADVDYMPKLATNHGPRLLTFKPGQTHKFVTVVVLGDDLAEATEGVDVVFANPTNATFAGGATGHVTILDDDS